MVSSLRERGDELRALADVLDAAIGGRGGVVLVTGEAGIGKTALVRAFLRTVAGRARPLVGACDDLLSPRVLGPLRDAAQQAGGALADALAAGDREALFTAVLATLATPTVLVVEDAHWADDATLDVLRVVGRQIVDRPSVLVVTYRDEEVGSGHPLGPVVGALARGAATRIVLRSLSSAAVAQMGGTGVDGAAVHRLTGGNPFYVTEVLAAGGDPFAGDAVPGSVADTVVARVRRLDRVTQEALEQLSVVPSGTELPLARALLPDIGVLAEAERAGMLEVAPNAVRFRHELARRAVEASLAASRRMQLNAAALAALRGPGHGREPERARIVHHAVRAGDDAAVVEFGPPAADAALRAGAANQALVLYRETLARDGLAADRRADLHQDYARTLASVGRNREAIDAYGAAVALREQAGDPVRLAMTLATRASLQWSELDVDDAEAAGRRASALLDGERESVERATAQAQLAALMANMDRDEEALALADAALAAAERLGVPSEQVRGLLHRGRARTQLGDEGGIDDMAEALRRAHETGDSYLVVVGYLTLAAGLWRLGRFTELQERVGEALAFAGKRDFHSLVRGVAAFGHRVEAARGAWTAAEEGLRALLAGGGPNELLRRLSLPTLALLAVRRGRPDADAQVTALAEYAARSRALFVAVPAAAARAEQGWLTGDPGAGDLARQLLPDLAGPGRERYRAEMLWWLGRLGDPVAPFPGCPEPYASGLRGDWRRAAQRWDEQDAPYERALELVGSGDTGALLEALAVLDGLGAAPAAALTRRRLRAAGVTQIPRGPQAVTRAHPAGLTGRQQEILGLMSDGLTNAEIAARLVLSVRTVDHHVSAVLAKLGAATRGEAVAAARVRA